MFTGKLDRLVTLESNSPSQDTFGEPVESWSTIQNVWAEKMTAKAVERFTNNARQGFKYHTWRIRWRSDISNLSRLTYDSQNYDILGVTEVGRKHFLILETELVS